MVYHWLRKGYGWLSLQLKSKAERDEGQFKPETTY